MKRVAAALWAVFSVGLLAWLYSAAFVVVGNVLWGAGTWGLLTIEDYAVQSFPTSLKYVLLCCYPLWGVVVGIAARQALKGARWAGAPVGLVHAAMVVVSQTPPPNRQLAAAVLLVAAVLGCTVGGLILPRRRKVKAEVAPRPEQAPVMAPPQEQIHPAQPTPTSFVRRLLSYLFVLLASALAW
jgi:hypothetical protein